MNVIGNGVNPQVVEEVSEAIRVLFEDVSGHWKRDVFNSMLVVLTHNVEAYLASNHSHPAHSFIFAVPMSSSEPFDLDDVVSDLLALYIEVLITTDSKVDRTVQSVLSRSYIPRNQILFFLVMWFISQKDAERRMSRNAAQTCAAIDRSLRRGYVATSQAGLLIQ